jgi:hypothetical protein
MLVELCLINTKAKKNLATMVLGRVSKIQTMFGVVVMSHVSLRESLYVIFVTYVHQTTIFGGC